MICRYCNGPMMTQGTDRIMGDYCELFVCINDKCQAVFEAWRDLKGRSLPYKNQWFNPQTSEFEK